MSHLLDYSPFSNYVHLGTSKENFIQIFSCREADEYVHTPSIYSQKLQKAEKQHCKMKSNRA